MSAFLEYRLDDKRLLDLQRAAGLQRINGVLKRVYANTAIVAHADVIRHFKDETGPDRAWKPLKKPRRRGGSKILQDTGRLRGSIVPKSDTKGAEVSTKLEYAGVHNYGFPKKRIPKREFMWISKKSVETIMRAVAVEMTDHLNGRFG